MYLLPGYLLNTHFQTNVVQVNADMGQTPGEILETTVLLDRSGILIETDNLALVCYFSYSPTPSMPKLSSQVIKASLKKAGIVYGLIEDEINDLDGQEEPTRNRVVARGKKPSVASDPKLKYFFKTEPYKGLIKDKNTGQVDFRQRGEIPFVKADEVLAEITFDEGTEPGFSVTGEEVAVEIQGKGEIEAGLNVRIEDDKLIANIEGAPRLNDGKVEVQPEWTVDGDIEIRTGNIIYPGNVNIRGVVQPGFEVHAKAIKCKGVENKTVINAQGNLYIDGGIQGGHITCAGRMETRFINNASVECVGDVEVKLSIINSDIRTSGLLTAQTIFGGSIAAKKGVTCVNLSSEANRATVIFGIDPINQKNISEIVRKKIEIEEKISIIKEKMGDDLDLFEEIEKLREELKTMVPERDALIQRRKAIDPNDEASLEFFDMRLEELATDIDPKEKEINEHGEKVNMIAKTYMNELMEAKRFNAMLEKLEEEQKEAGFKEETLSIMPKLTVRGKALLGTRVSSSHARLVLNKDFQKVVFAQRTIAESDRKKMRGKKFFLSMERL